MSLPAPTGAGFSQVYCEQGCYVAEGQVRCLAGHELPKGVLPDESPTVISQLPIKNEEIIVADQMTYDKGYHYVRDNDDHDDLFVAAAVHAEGDANRDVADAGRDLAASNAGGVRDLVNANADANRDVLDANRDLFQALHGAGRDRDLTEQIGRVERVVVEQAKDNVIVTQAEGSRGREVTLETKADLMKEHCETQKLVIKEASDTRAAVREEAERTRELVRDEHRALLQRELDAKSEENTLLKLQINLLSSGTGPLVK